VGILTSCAASNRLTLDWANSDYAGKVDNVLVIGIGEDATKTRVFENALTERLQSEGIQAKPSFSTFPPGELSEQQLKDSVAAANVDAVLVTRVISIDKETEYVPPMTTSHYAPYSYYSGMYPYYHSSYMMVTEPGYYQENTIATLESNLYDASDATLIWSAQSEAFNPTNVEKVIKDISRLIVQSLNSQGVLVTAKAK
jgi:hypothetical protein